MQSRRLLKRKADGGNAAYLDCDDICKVAADEICFQAMVPPDNSWETWELFEAWFAPEDAMARSPQRRKKLAWRRFEGWRAACRKSLNGNKRFCDDVHATLRSLYPELYVVVDWNYWKAYATTPPGISGTVVHSPPAAAAQAEAAA